MVNRQIVAIDLHSIFLFLLWKSIVTVDNPVWKSLAPSFGAMSFICPDKTNFYLHLDKTKQKHIVDGFEVDSYRPRFCLFLSCLWGVFLIKLHLRNMLILILNLTKLTGYD